MVSGEEASWRPVSSLSILPARGCSLGAPVEVDSLAVTLGRGKIDRVVSFPPNGNPSQYGSMAALSVPSVQTPGTQRTRLKLRWKFTLTGHTHVNLYVA